VPLLPHAKSHLLTLSGGESGATLLATTADDRTTETGCHSGEETEATFATSIRGLKSSFHFLLYLAKIVKRSTVRTYQAIRRAVKTPHTLTEQ
jgi:hypothetical protein